MRKLAILAIFAAIVAAVMAIGNGASWRGEVYARGRGTPVEGATVLLVARDSVLSTTTTDADGEFRVTVGWKRKPEHRLMVCKTGSEPSALFERPPAGKRFSITSERGRYPLSPAQPGFVAPAVARLSSVLPPECQ